MDILLGHRLDLLQAVGARNGVDRLSLLHNMDEKPLAVDNLGLVRELHGLATGHLRLSRIER